MVRHTIICKICGVTETINLDRGFEQYLQDIMEELGWFKNQRGEWICPECPERQQYG